MASVGPSGCCQALRKRREEVLSRLERINEGDFTLPHDAFWLRAFGSTARTEVALSKAEADGRALRAENRELKEAPSKGLASKSSFI